MRFAVVGDHEEALLLVHAINAASDHSLVGCCLVGTLAERVAAIGSGAPQFANADELILNSDVDAVVVASHDCEESVRLVRRATQEDKHVVAIIPDAVSTAYSYELHLLLDESQVGIVVFSGRWYAPVAVNARSGSDSVRQLNLAFGLSQDHTLQRRRQIHAIDAMCGVGYRFSQVTGLDIHGAAEELQTRTVTLAAGRVEDLGVPPATIKFDVGYAVPTRLCVTYRDGIEESYPTALPDPASAADVFESDGMLRKLVEALTDSTTCQFLMEQFSNSLELLEGLDKSLRRRRTVDVYLDSVSERAVFKTQMTAIGCGILAYMSFGLVAYLVIAQVFSLSPTLLYVARIIWLAPLVLFMLAQLLLPLARERGQSTGKVDEGGSDAAEN